MSKPPPALVGVLTLVGFLLVVTGTATSAANQTEAPRKQALLNQILQERTNVDDLDKAVAEVRERVAQVRTESGQASQQQDAENIARQALAMGAGTVALEGPGLTVELSDAPRQPDEDATKFDASRIQDGDLQLVVNALLASGAEAVAVNDNRVVAVTPIRAAGGTIVVNYRPVSSPYRIVAIGADRAQFDATEIGAHFREWEKKFNLGFEVQKRRVVSVPAYSGTVAIDIALAATQGSAAGVSKDSPQPASRRR